MRWLAEILIVVALIALGWGKSFHETVSELPVIGSYFAPANTSTSRQTARRNAAQPTGAQSPALTQSTAVPHSDSILDPSHKTVLDKPIDPPNKTFTGHILYKDEAGKSYWLDAQGQRHY
jgi:hypothetical protein